MKPRSLYTTCLGGTSFEPNPQSFKEMFWVWGRSDLFANTWRWSQTNLHVHVAVHQNLKVVFGNGRRVFGNIQVLGALRARPTKESSFEQTPGRHTASLNGRGDDAMGTIVVAVPHGHLLPTTHQSTTTAENNKRGPQEPMGVPPRRRRGVKSCWSTEGQFPSSWFEKKAHRRASGTVTCPLGRFRCFRVNRSGWGLRGRFCVLWTRGWAQNGGFGAQHAAVLHGVPIPR